MSTTTYGTFASLDQAKEERVSKDLRKGLGRVIRPSTNTKGDYSQIENIQLQVFTALDVSKNSPQGQTVQNSEESAAQALQASVSEE